MLGKAVLHALAWATPISYSRISIPLGLGWSLCHPTGCSAAVRLCPADGCGVGTAPAWSWCSTGGLTVSGQLERTGMRSG